MYFVGNVAHKSQFEYIKFVCAQVGSRITWLGAGIIYIVVGLIGKFGAILTCLPDPIIGGSQLLTIGLIFASGIANLQYVDMNASRSLLIVASSYMLGIIVPFWILDNPGVINTGQ